MLQDIAPTLYIFHTRKWYKIILIFNPIRSERFSATLGFIANLESAFISSSVESGTFMARVGAICFGVAFPKPGVLRVKQRHFNQVPRF